MDYSTINQAKAIFDDVYTAPTPNSYFAKMSDLDYQISEQARPYFTAAAALLAEQLGPNQPVRMLDLGCSYGVGSALLNHDLCFDDLVSFFTTTSTAAYRDAVEQTQEFLAENRVHKPIEVIGADASAEAIRFAVDAGLLKGGIARDLENTPRLPSAEAAMVRQCNMLTSTGAIGYVGGPTISTLLDHLGNAQADLPGPFTVVTILRMFDPDPVGRTFNDYGYVFARVPGITLPQRRFESEEEQLKTIRLLQQRSVDPTGLETDGLIYAELFAAAPKSEIGELIECLSETAAKAA